MSGVGQGTNKQHVQNNLTNSQPLTHNMYILCVRMGEDRWVDWGIYECTYVFVYAR